MLSIGMGLWSSQVVSGGGGGGGATLSSPVATPTSSTAATVGATTDTGSGTLYYVVTTSATPPSATQIKAGQNEAGSAAAASGNVAVSSTGAKTFSATGLTSLSNYWVYFIQNTGADSNIPTLAFIGGLGPERVTDGGFTSSANWNVGTSWTVGSGQASAAGSSDGILWQSATITASHVYRTVFTLSSYSAGQVSAYLGSAVTAGTARTANGTYTQNITPTGGGELGFSPNGTFVGVITNYSVREVLP